MAGIVGIGMGGMFMQEYAVVLILVKKVNFTNGIKCGNMATGQVSI
ncbi:TPA: hypothetical protein JIU75_18290 [Acinetobacter baumannii]|nr:hypothetical protein [Acinetobacter baumannii]HAV4911248.1 hypothetical protein [Acinetobacter baumannii]HAV4921452.1 hypothetical protein [Acinetobacter baumannii]